MQLRLQACTPFARHPGRLHCQARVGLGLTELPQQMALTSMPRSTESRMGIGCCCSALCPSCALSLRPQVYTSPSPLTPTECLAPKLSAAHLPEPCSRKHRRKVECCMPNGAPQNITIGAAVGFCSHIELQGGGPFAGRTVCKSAAHFMRRAHQRLQLGNIATDAHAQLAVRIAA